MGQYVMDVWMYGRMEEVVVDGTDSDGNVASGVGMGSGWMGAGEVGRGAVSPGIQPEL